METVYTVTKAWNGDSPDGSATADVEVFTTLEAARAYYEHERTTYTGRDYVGLWSTEYPNGSVPDEVPTHGWTIAYASPGPADQAFDQEDAVGIRLAVHTVHDERPSDVIDLERFLHGNGALDQIFAAMDGEEWNSDLWDVIAPLVLAGTGNERFRGPDDLLPGYERDLLPGYERDPYTREIRKVTKA